MEDRPGRLWVGTRSGGLFSVVDGRLHRYSTHEGLPSHQVWALWIGRYGGGLNRLHDGKLTSITTKDGLFNGVVFRILEDDLGNLWMSCNEGIFRVAKRELEELAAGKRSRVTSVPYGTADGMKSAECNSGQHAGWKTRDGRLWFPTIRGVVVVDPRHLPINEVVPPVVIEEMLVYGTL